MSTTRRRLCLVNPSGGAAGPAAFQRRLADGLAARGHAVAYGLGDQPYQAALVVGGTRDLAGLAGLRRRGIPLLQRLDGINWLHRRVRTGSRHYLRAEINNLLMRLIRRRLASAVVYQSQFARDWWERQFGPAPIPSAVVYNGVPLDRFTPEGEADRPVEGIRMLVVEGRLGGGYEVGLRAAADLAQRLALTTGEPVELVVAGELAQGVRSGFPDIHPARARWLGTVPPDAIPALDRSAHLLFAADLNAACPNAVLEALACGLPVVSYATGALPELVEGQSGMLAPYGGDPWKLEPPDVDGLAQAAAAVLAELEAYRLGARQRAESAFGQERMVEGYLRALGWD